MFPRNVQLSSLHLEGNRSLASRGLRLGLFLCCPLLALLALLSLLLLDLFDLLVDQSFPGLLLLGQLLLFLAQLGLDLALWIQHLRT